MGLFNNPFSKNQSPAPGAMSTVPMDAPGVQPSVDADIRQADPKLRAGEHEKLSPDLQTRLQELRVDESTLVRGMKYEDLTLYEKKSVLINRALDELNVTGSSILGLGRYQWCIFFLCGFGYFLDLAWAQAFGLVVGPIQQELGIPDNEVGNLSTAFSSGLTVGAFFWGLAVDIIGRKWCFNLTCLIASVFGLIFAGPSNWGGLCFIASMIGLGVGGNIPIDATITLEFLPTNRRFLLAMLSTFQPVGVVTACLIAWGLVPKYSCDATLPACSTGQAPCCNKSSNMGWRYLMITLGCLTLAVFLARFFLFNFQESPKFLLFKGHDEEAIEVVHHVARFNKAPVPDLTIEDFRLLDQYYKETASVNLDDEEAAILHPKKRSFGEQTKAVWKGFLGTFVHLKFLFSTKRMLWTTTSLWIAYMSLFFSFSIAGGFLPLILRYKGISTETSISTTYRNYVIIYAPGIAATLLAGAMMEIPAFGRKWSMAIAAALMATSLFLFSTVNSFNAFTGLNLLEYFMQSLYSALLYAATPELFPAPVRGSASGLASTLGRLASVVAPVAAQTIYNPAANGVFYLAGGAALVSMLAIATLPFDTRGKQTF